MDKDQVLTFVKTHAFPLSCGVVALAAVGLWFVPLGGYVQGLNEESTKEAGAFTQFNGYLTKSRTLPVLDPAQKTPTQLPSFPTDPQVKEGQKAVATLADDGKSAMAYIVALNDDKGGGGPPVHPELVTGLLPKPPQDSQDKLKVYFADTYRDVLSLDPTMSGVGAEGNVLPPVQAVPPNVKNVPQEPMPANARLRLNKARNLYNDVLMAGQPPAQMLVHGKDGKDLPLIDARRQWVWANQFAIRIVYQDGKPEAHSRDQVVADYTAAARQIPDQLAAEVARTRKVYLDKDAFGLQQAFLPTATGNPTLSEVWLAQMSLWVQADVATAVAAINAPGTGGVAGSPVKRILKFDLASQQAIYRNPPAAGGGATAGGVPGTGDETSDLKPTYAVSPSGRTSNKMYDVVPFSLLIDVDATKVNQVLAGLTKDRLIYIDNQSVYGVDPATLAPAGYLYGPGPVVRLAISGEELFLRSWTTRLMPDSIKVQLGLMAGTPGQGGGVPGLPGGQD